MEISWRIEQGSDFWRSGVGSPAMGGRGGIVFFPNLLIYFFSYCLFLGAKQFVVSLRGVQDMKYYTLLLVFVFDIHVI